jgi:hypothetical protein
MQNAGLTRSRSHIFLATKLAACSYILVRWRLFQKRTTIEIRKTFSVTVMKLSHTVTSAAVLACLVGSLLAATNDGFVPHTSAGEQKSLSVTTNDVVLIKNAAGAVAVIQFTSFGPDTATYRWRCLPANSKAITSGKGQVRESYDRKDGGSVTPKADHDPIVKAGEFTLEWSYGNRKKGWLYYNPDRHSVEVLAADAFDRDL